MRTPTRSRRCSRSTTARSRLGELALVDRQGRIGPLGTVFYNTLLDENAASHIALGAASSSSSTTRRARVNESGTHIDFMIGSTELDVDGVTAAASASRCSAAATGRSSGPAGRFVGAGPNRAESVPCTRCGAGASRLA